jgi:hypothetical protein
VLSAGDREIPRTPGRSDVAFTMKQYVQTDSEADRQVANTLAELIVGGALSHTTPVYPVSCCPW